jgi:uncharacterized protein YqjF (DUF2071 family)
MGSLEQNRHPRRVFISAEWRNLLMLNYEGTEIDTFAGRTYLSLVGFRFLRTRLFGICPVPFHSDFDEVNLRFYVQRREGVTARRGVVFIREIVPKWAVAQVAHVVFGENYSRFPMRHSVQDSAVGLAIEYQWQANHQWCRLYGQISGSPIQPGEGSLEQFITEHYWGYSSRRRSCLEYEVAHAPWKVWRTSTAGFEGNGSSLYGHQLDQVLQDPPASAFVADGSCVSVFNGRRLP